MTSDDRKQISSHLDTISEEEIENILDKLLSNKDLNVEERRTIYFVLKGEWEPALSFSNKTGPKPRQNDLRTLAEEVEKELENGIKICKIMSDLGEKYKLHGREKILLVTFNKNLKRGRDALAEQRKFLKIRAARKSRKPQ